MNLHYNLFICLDYPETLVLSCAFAIKLCFPSEILAVTKTTSKYIEGLQDPFKDKYMNGKLIINLNHYKSMLATIHTKYVNKKIIRIYLFCPFSMKHKTNAF